MAAIVMRVRAELGARWRSWIALGLVFGVAGGVVLASIAGARRTESSYPRFLVDSEAADLRIFGPPGFLDFEAVARLPEVAESGTVHYMAMFTEREQDALGTAPTRESTIAWFVSPDGVFERFNRSAVVAGRRPVAADEIAVNPAVAEAFDLALGDSLRVRALGPDELEELLITNVVDPDGPEIVLRVVGIEVAAGELLPISEVGTAHLSPAFFETYRDSIAIVPGTFVKLRNGASDLPAFQRGVDAIGGQPAELLSAAYETRLVQRGVGIVAQALRLFALLAGIAWAFTAYQALTRQIYSEADDHPPLSAIGFTRVQLWGSALLRTACIGIVAAIVAVATSWALSPIFPLGTGRIVEPSPGIDIDGTTSGLGAVAIVLALIVLAARPAWRASDARSMAKVAVTGSARAGRLPRALIRMSASPAAVAGVTMATDVGDRRRAVPVRSAVGGCAGALAALILAFTLGASLDRLLSTPALYGWQWDAVFGSPYGGDIGSRASGVDRIAEVDSSAIIGFAQLDIDGSRITALTFEGERGLVPSVVAGRAPRSDDEIMVGRKVIRDGAGIGDTVTVEAGPRRTEMRVVGIGVFPSLGRSEISGLGEGALLTADGMRRVVPEFPRNMLALRFAPGADERRGIVAVREALGGSSLHATLETPVEVAHFEELERVPLVMAALLAVVAGTTLGHVLVTTVRRRRREVAILKTLGFVRGQVLSTLAWQSTTMIAFALAAGVPVGLIAGRTTWRAFADNLGIVPAPAIPWTAVAAVVPAAIVAANLVAAFPARAAADTEPAVALRSL